MQCTLCTLRHMSLVHIKSGGVERYNVDPSQLLYLKMPVLLASVIEKLAAIVEDGNLFYFTYHHLFP